MLAVISFLKCYVNVFMLNVIIVIIIITVNTVYILPNSTVWEGDSLSFSWFLTMFVLFFFSMLHMEVLTNWFLFA